MKTWQNSIRQHPSERPTKAAILMGYGTQQFCGPKTNVISGWSEKVLDFIMLAEQGEDALEKRIANYVIGTVRSSDV